MPLDLAIVSYVTSAFVFYTIVSTVRELTRAEKACGQLLIKMLASARAMMDTERELQLAEEIDFRTWMPIT